MASELQLNNLKMYVQIYSDSPTIWDSYVHSHPNSFNYQQYNWKKVIEESFGHKSYYLSCIEDSGALCGVLPLISMRSRIFGNLLVSMPFFNYGGLLSNSDLADACLLKAAEDLRCKISASSVELRMISPLGRKLPTKTQKVTMILDLEPNIDQQWKVFNAKLRNQIRKAEKNGLQVMTGGVELLDGFYSVFCQNMRDLGTPVYCKEFFGNVLKYFPDTTKIFSVVHADMVIASAIACWFRDTLEIPWASSIRKFRTLCPNNLLYWKGIMFAIEGGFAKLDFGRSTRNEGTYNFKQQWGAKPVQLHWQYLLDAGAQMPQLNPKNPKYRMATAIWQRLPVGLTKFLGPRIVRNIP
jgi:serine/alanine adding enzyme